MFKDQTYPGANGGIMKIQQLFGRTIIALASLGLFTARLIADPSPALSAFREVLAAEGEDEDANGLFMLEGLGCANTATQTCPTSRYERDPHADRQFVFNDYSAVPGYSDPDASEWDAALRAPSPLDNPIYYSYNLIILVNKDRQNGVVGQRMRVYQRGVGLIKFWKISTARPGKLTPSGFFRPQLFSSMHRSSIYDSPMPYAVFFNGNIAMHATSAVAALGTRASAGCVRLELQRAEDLFHLVGQSGFGLVDAINEGSGDFARDQLGFQRWVESYQTLVIVK